jgi:hypothetical protein
MLTIYSSTTHFSFKTIKVMDNLKDTGFKVIANNNKQEISKGSSVQFSSVQFSSTAKCSDV